jgi:hypothetical protein
MVMAMAVGAQDNRGQSYTVVQIEQFVAPVALYPDALLAQVFMASTYPVEVVEASGWARQNPNLRGDALAVALDGQNWDVSVKSLVPFPNVLYRMAENEAWTQDLGEAYLAQPNDVMDSVQSMRHRAYQAGNLRTSSYQRVSVQGQYIQIVPVNVQTVYVPAYNPTVVYGAGWGYSNYYYPAMMQPPPYYVAGNVISFGVGFVVGAALFGAFDWNHHNVYYGDNFYHYRGYHRNAVVYQQRYPHARPGYRSTWEHDPVHRGPGGYRNEAVKQRYGHGNTRQPGHGDGVGNPPRPGDHGPQPYATNPKRNGQVRQPKATNPKHNGPERQPKATNPKHNGPERQPKATNPKHNDQERQPKATNPQRNGQERQPKAANPQRNGQERQPKAANPQRNGQERQPKATNPQRNGQERQPKASNQKPSGQNRQPAQSNNASKGGGKQHEKNK